MDILEYDEKKMTQDVAELKNIIREMKDDVSCLMASDVFYNYKLDVDKEMALIKDDSSSCSIDWDIKREKKRLNDICLELDYIVQCVEKSRDKYIRCEEKISDLLYRLKGGLI